MHSVFPSYPLLEKAVLGTALHALLQEDLGLPGFVEEVAAEGERRVTASGPKKCHEDLCICCIRFRVTAMCGHKMWLDGPVHPVRVSFQNIWQKDSGRIAWHLMCCCTKTRKHYL